MDELTNNMICLIYFQINNSGANTDLQFFKTCLAGFSVKFGVLVGNLVFQSNLKVGTKTPY